MDAKEYLKQIGKIERMIKNKQIEKEQWVNLASGTTAQIGSERVRSSGSQSKMSDAIIKAVDIEAEIIELIEKRKKIIKTIEQLSEDEYNVLHMRYVRHMTSYFDIGLECGKRSESWATTTRRKALKSLQVILDKE